LRDEKFSVSFAPFQACRRRQRHPRGR
jgi:hypothetical protein